MPDHIELDRRNPHPDESQVRDGDRQREADETAAATLVRLSRGHGTSAGTLASLAIRAILLAAARRQVLTQLELSHVAVEAVLLEQCLV